MAEKLSSCVRKSKAIVNVLLHHPFRPFRERLIDHPGLAGQVERRLGWWIESDGRAVEAAQELGGFGIVQADLISFATMDEDVFLVNERPVQLVFERE